jgi:hypothetical protein
MRKTFRLIPRPTSPGLYGIRLLIYNSQKVSAAFLEQFRLACRISNRAFQELVGEQYGVRWVETFELGQELAPLEREPTEGAQLYPETKILREPERYFGSPYVRQFSTMLIEPPVYMNALLRDFYIAGGKVVVKEFRSCEEIASLPPSILRAFEQSRRTVEGS